MSIQVLVLPIANPILIGIYHNYTLQESIISKNKASDSLPIVFSDIFSKYKKIDQLFYTNGPGSFMSIKITYIFLKTLSIVKNIGFKACSGFAFNDHSPIKALGKNYFFGDKNGDIKISILENNLLQDFSLPKILNIDMFYADCTPTYNLPVTN